MTALPRDTLTVVQVLLPFSENRRITLSCAPSTEARAFHEAVVDKLNKIKNPGVPDARSEDFFLTEKEGKEESSLFDLPAPGFFKAMSKLANNNKDGTDVAILHWIEVTGKSGKSKKGPTDLEKKALRMDQQQQRQSQNPMLQAATGEPSGSRAGRDPPVDHEQVKQLFHQCSEGPLKSHHSLLAIRLCSVYNCDVLILILFLIFFVFLFRFFPTGSFFFLSLCLSGSPFLSLLFMLLMLSMFPRRPRVSVLQAVYQSPQGARGTSREAPRTHRWH